MKRSQPLAWFLLLLAAPSLMGSDGAGCGGEGQSVAPCTEFIVSPMEQTLNLGVGAVWVGWTPAALEDSIDLQLTIEASEPIIALSVAQSPDSSPPPAPQAADLDGTSDVYQVLGSGTEFVATVPWNQDLVIARSEPVESQDTQVTLHFAVIDEDPPGYQGQACSVEVRPTGQSLITCGNGQTEGFETCDPGPEGGRGCDMETCQSLR
ncbi:MAG: hypothetical protein KC561_08025 [Myxococcales bacterium]|nr:hypothetical protein [Myxococcales bacterium]